MTIRSESTMIPLAQEPLAIAERMTIADSKGALAISMAMALMIS